MQRRLYSLLLRLALPVAAGRYLWRHRRDHEPIASLPARLAIGAAARSDAPLWLHGASVGELRAMDALLHAMIQPPPVLVTSGTPTGCRRAQQLFGAAGHQVRAVPWDLPGATRRFIAAVRPRALVIVETELWPNLIAAAAAQGVPLALLSARISARSLQRYRRFAPAMMRDAVRAFGVIGAQTEADRRRFIELGAIPARVRIVGNLKFDVPLDPAVPERGALLRARWAPDRPLWMAGSTHAGEEKLLIQAQQRLLARARAQQAPAPVLALAPRRPERFAAVARWLDEQGLPVARTGTAAATPGGRAPDIVLVDQMGVLPDWYAAADAAFVGGSLVPVGGHNLLEPAALARPVLCGPHTFSAPQVARSLVEAGGARVVRDVDELTAGLVAWLEDPAAAASAGANAAAVVVANHGAAGRAVELLMELLASSAPSATG